MSDVHVRKALDLKAEAEKRASAAADKARQRAQERVRLGESEMLGMTPKLWLEALDEEHRHGSSLHQYWQRWEASRTRRPACPKCGLGRATARHSASGAMMPLRVHGRA